MVLCQGPPHGLLGCWSHDQFLKMETKSFTIVSQISLNYAPNSAGLYWTSLDFTGFCQNDWSLTRIGTLYSIAKMRTKEEQKNRHGIDSC